MRPLPLLPLLLVAGLLGPALWADEGDLTSRRFDVGILVAPRSPTRGSLLRLPATWACTIAVEEEWPEPEPFLHPDMLVELIRNRVEPESWDDLEGAYLTIQGRWLWARSHPHVLRKVAALVEDLARRAEGRVALAVEVAGGDGARRESGSLEIPFGVRRALESVRRRAFVMDYDVEIAQGSNITDPVVNLAEEGLVVDFLADPTVDGEQVLLEMLVQYAEPRPGRELELGFDEEYLPGPYRQDQRFRNGRLELPIQARLAAHVTTLVPATGTTAIPVAVGGERYEVRIRAESLGAAGHPALIDLGALCRPPRGLYFGYGGEEEDDWPGHLRAPRLRYVEPEGPALAPAEDLAETISWLVDPWWWQSEGELQVLGSSGLLLRAPEDVVARTREFLRSREHEALRPVVVDLRALSATGPVETGAGGSFSTEDAVLDAAGRVHTIVGRHAFLVAGSTANYLADYDVEVAQESRIADPIVGQCFDGFLANLRPHLSVDGGTVALDLDFLLSRSRILEEPFDSGTQHLGPMDRVEQKRVALDTTIHVPVGGTYVLDLGADPDDPAARIVLEVRVEVPAPR